MKGGLCNSVAGEFCFPIEHWTERQATSNTPQTDLRAAKKEARQMEAAIEQHQSLSLPHQQQQQQLSNLAPNPQQPQHIFFPPPSANHPHAANGWMMPAPPPMNGHDQQHAQEHQQALDAMAQQQQQQQIDGGGNGESLVGGEDVGLELDADVDGEEGEDEDVLDGRDTPEMMMVEGQQTSESKGPGPTRRSKRNNAAASASHIVRGVEGKVSLADLKDCPPGVKPYHAYSTLIRYAIKGSPSGKFLFCFCFFHDHPKGEAVCPATWGTSTRDLDLSSLHFCGAQTRRRWGMVVAL